MKLIIRRDQALVKGPLELGENESVGFSSFCKVELTEQQKELVSKYKPSDCDLRWIKISPDAIALPLKVSSLIDGVTCKAKNITELSALEETIKQSCGDLKKLMEASGEEEVVEF